jgi:6-phosphogluconolactonase (cycloisomerase 2 family)
MQKFLGSRLSKSWLSCAVALLAGVLALNAFAAAATSYVVTNDDSVYPFFTGVTFYTIGANGLPVLKKQVSTGSFGIAGGYFGANRISVLNSTDQQCIYASEAGNNDVVGIVVSTLTLGGKASGSATDGGTSNGIGLAMNGDFLYASFTDSNTIGTFQIEEGCSLVFVTDTAVAGLQAGVINGMAVHGNLLIATYTDGSIESFNIAGGTPVSNGDEQLSTGTVQSQESTFPNTIDITSDGHFAIFGDTSTSVVIEVSDISSGELGKTTFYKSPVSISSSNIMLSPDETFIYAVNTQGAAVSAIHFNKTTGKLYAGCTSGPLKGQSVNYSYLVGAALINTATGNGGGLYVAEFGSTSAIAVVNLATSGNTCTLKEATGSPVVDPNTPGLLSIGSYPPRSF